MHSKSTIDRSGVSQLEATGGRPPRRKFFQIALTLAATGTVLVSNISAMVGSVGRLRWSSLPAPANRNAAIPAAGAEGDSLGARIGNEAEHIVHTLQHTHYQHHEVIDPDTGTYDVDCSGFVGYVLKRIAPQQYEAVPKESGWSIPRAFKYEEFFRSIAGHSQDGWRAISELAHVRRGDIVAWSLPQNLGKEADTGHVFIVAKEPEHLDDGMLAVRVCDSSTVKHYDDSRAQDGTFHTGVGTGTIHFKVDGAGKPVSFQFGKGDKFHEVPITIGRAI